MKKMMLPLVAVIVGCAMNSSQMTDSSEELRAAVAADVAKAVRPGGIDGQPFWNGASRLFMYPPAFDFKPVAGAAKYRYRAANEGGSEMVFEAAKPTETLEAVWPSLQSGWVTLKVEALGADGKVLGLAGEKKLWKSAAFEPGAYPAAPWSYGEAARRYYDFLWAMKNTRSLAETGVGDEKYRHNAYPSKIYSALIEALVDYSKRKPEKSAEILNVAIKGGDYLISLSQPEGTPLAGFTPTYHGTWFEAGKYAGQNMLIYPASAGSAFLKLYGATKEKRFLAAAERIAATYLRLQGKDGTWTLKIHEKDGADACPNRLMPTLVMEFLEELHEVTGERRYRDAADRAFAFVEKGPLTDWNWEGQFEDVRPTKPYVNLTIQGACEAALYLMKRFPDDPKRIAQVREIVRFCEDQFVCWQLPATKDLASSPLPIDDQWAGVKHWKILPGALEQYGWYVPIDRKAGMIIRVYLALYRAERKPLDLAKARVLGDSIVRAQAANVSDGIPTQWCDWDMKEGAEPWISCGIAAAGALVELEDVK